MSAKFLTDGLQIWNSGVDLNDDELHDKIREYVRANHKVDRQRSNMSKLKSYIIDIKYAGVANLPPRIKKLGMSQKVFSNDFLENGFSVYKKYKDSDKLKDALIKYTSGYYPEPRSRNRQFITLKKAVAKEFKDPTVLDMMLPRHMYDQVFKIDKAALAEKGKNCVTIDNADSLFSRILNGIKSDKIEDLYPAILLATGRRLSEITKYGSFHKTDDHYVAVFEGQLKTDDNTPYAIPTMLPVTIVNTGLAKLRDILADDPKLATSFYVGRIIKAAFGIDVTAHSLRAMYAVAMYKMRDGQFKKFNESQYVSMILGHKDTDSVAHYTCYKLNGLTKVKYMEPPTRPTTRPSKSAVAQAAMKQPPPIPPKPAAVVPPTPAAPVVVEPEYPPIIHNAGSTAERKLVANINQLRREGKRVSQNGLRLLKSSPAVIKRVFARNPGLQQ